MPPIFTSTYVILGIIGSLFVLLMTVLVFFVMVVSLLIGGCYCSYQTRKFHPTFGRLTITTSLPPSYSNSDIAPLVLLQGMGPSTRFIQDGESEDSNSAGSSRNSNSIGQRLLPATPGISSLIHSRRYHARSSQRSDGYSSRSEGHSGTRASVLLSGNDSRSERQDQNRRRQARSPQCSDEYAPRSKRRRQSRSPDLSSRDGSRSNQLVRNHRSDNAHSRSRYVGRLQNPGSSRGRSYQRGSGSGQWRSLSCDGRPGLSLAYEADGDNW